MVKHFHTRVLNMILKIRENNDTFAWCKDWLFSPHLLVMDNKLVLLQLKKWWHKSNVLAVGFTYTSFISLINYSLFLLFFSGHENVLDFVKCLFFVYFGIIIEFLPIFHLYDILIHFQILNQTCTVGINPIRSLCIIMLLNPSSYYLPPDRPINQEFKNSDFFYTERNSGGLVVTHFLVLARPWKGCDKPLILQLST